MDGLESTEIKENPGENETKDVNLEMISPNYDKCIPFNLHYELHSDF